MTTLTKVINHSRNHSYMSGVERDKLRIKATGEIFTPTPLVQEMLDQLPSEVFTDPTKTFIDPSCGDGQFLSEVLIRKMENGSTYEQALSTIYGVELMVDNAQLCRERLQCGQTKYKANIYEADFLEFASFLEVAEDWGNAIAAHQKFKKEKTKKEEQAKREAELKAQDNAEGKALDKKEEEEYAAQCANQTSLFSQENNNDNT